MNWKRSEEDREYLRTRFPGCFGRKGETKRPLAVGILNDIVALVPELSKTRIRQALQNYTSGPTYQRNLIPGVVRINLLGDDAGTVTAEQSQHAKEQLKAMRKRKREATKKITVTEPSHAT